MEGEMIKKILVLLFCVYFIISIPITIIYYVIEFVYRWKCRKKHYYKYTNPCHEKECKWSKHCEDYRHIPTPEERERIEQLIRNLKT